ncbi:hypothetical protein OAH18_00405, partial [bacterium]|nr:hypothetical protein [bacterium]
TSGGNWKVGSNWSGGSAPLSNATARISVGGAYTVTYNTFDGYAGQLLIENPDATLSIQPTHDNTTLDLGFGNVNNAGTLNMISNPSRRSNLSGGLLTNTGTFTTFGPNSGSNQTTVDMDVSNTTGTVNVGGTTGFTKENAVVTNNGSFNVTGKALFGDNATFNQNGGTLNNSGEFEMGNDTFNMNGGTFTNTGTFKLDNMALNLNGGTVTGSALDLRTVNLTIGSGVNAENMTFNLTGLNGTFSGDLTATQTLNLTATHDHASYTTGSINNAGALNLTSDVSSRTAFLTGDQLTNSGTVNFNGTSATNRRLVMDLDNTATGTVNIDGNTSFTKTNVVINNNGEFNIAAGAKTVFSDNATFNQNGGTLNNSGEFEMGNDTFNMNGGTFTNNGTFKLDNMALNLNGGTVTGNALDLHRINLTIGSGVNAENMTFNLTGSGTFAGDLTATQTLNLTATHDHTSYTTGNVNNAGTLNLNSSSNRAARLSGDTMTNTGTINLNGTSTYGELLMELNNSGTINAHVESYIGKSGAVNTNSGTVSLLDSSKTLRFYGSSVTNMEGGTLTGVGEMDFASVTGGLVNNGTIAPGLSPGQLTIDGDVTFGATSDLIIELGGLTQGLEYDFLLGRDTIFLDGALSVSFLNGYESLISGSDSFTILSANGGLSGIFGGLSDGDTFLTADGFGSFIVNYDANNVMLSNFSVTSVPEPSIALTLLMTLPVLFLRRRRSVRL